MSLTIALDDLQAAGACKSACSKFHSFFGASATFETREELHAACTRFSESDRSWYASNIFPAPLGEEFDRQSGPLRAEFNRQCAPLWAEFDRQSGPLRAEFNRQRAPLYAGFDRQIAPLWAEFDRQIAPLREEFDRQTLDVFVTLLWSTRT